MNFNKMRKTAKGFTLIELIIVIAIIGILLGILMPSMWNYYRRSRIQAANTDAKMVYNAAQTASQRYISVDRTAATPSGLGGTVNIKSVNGTPQYSVGSNTFAAIDTTETGTACQAIAQSVNRTVSDGNEICWAVRIDNYIVKASIAAANTGATNVGSYSANRQMSTLDSPRVAYFNNDAALIVRLGALTSGYNNASAPSSP